MASVSAIYGLGDPELWRKASVLHVEKDSLYRRNKLLRQLVDIQYERNEFDIKTRYFQSAATRWKYCRFILKKRLFALIFLVMKLKLSRVCTR